MSDDIFKRSDVGHDAKDFHARGGLDAPEEDKTEREDLEDAIEALNDSEETEDLVDIEKDIMADDQDVEPIVEEAPSKAEKIEVKTAPKSEPKPEPKFEPKFEPVNSWKEKPENKPYMTIDSIEEPKDKKKKKCGLGWKIATFFFLILAVAGCAATAYIFFVDGKIELFGRTVESYKTGKKTNPQPQTPAKSTDDTSSDYVNVSKWGLKVKMPKDGKTLYQYDGSKLIVWYSTKYEGVDAIPAFSQPAKTPNGMAYIHFLDQKLEEPYDTAKFNYIGKIGKAEVYLELSQAAPVIEWPDEQAWFETSFQSLGDHFAQASNYIATE